LIADSSRFAISEVEIDYVKVLNRVLPKDIRIIGWCAVPLDFHARYWKSLTSFHMDYFSHAQLDEQNYELLS